jgi:hypothetical protein
MSLLALYWGWRVAFPAFSLSACTRLGARVITLGMAAGLAFFVSTPYAFLDRYYQHSLQAAWTVVSGQEFASASFLTWINTLVGQLGLPLCITAALATLALAVRAVTAGVPRGVVLALVLALSNILWYAALGRLWIMPGYLMVAYGLIGLVAGDFLKQCAGLLANRRPRLVWVARAAAVGLALVLVYTHWFPVTCIHFGNLTWNRATQFAAASWAEQNLPPGARVMWDDLAYFDPDRFPKQIMVGGVIKMNYLMYHQPDYLVLCATLYNSDWYRGLRQEQDCSLTDSYPFSVRLYQELLGRSDVARPEESAALPGVELVQVIRPMEPPSTRTAQPPHETSGWGRFAEYCRGEWLHNQGKCQYVYRMSRVVLGLEPFCGGAPMCVYRIHPQGGPSGRPGCISGGDEAGHEAVHAFFTYTAKGWRSAQRGADVAGRAYLGFDFGGGNARAVQKVFVKWLDPKHTPTAVKVQWSDDGRHWSDAAQFKPARVPVDDHSLDDFPLPDCGAHRYWRVLADAAVPGDKPIAIRELKLMEK